MARIAVYVLSILTKWDSRDAFYDTAIRGMACSLCLMDIAHPRVYQSFRRSQTADFSAVRHKRVVALPVRGGKDR